MQGHTRDRGFTLIELLVVIAVIAILAGILFPVFARAREKARQATCTSNLRQLAAAFEMYADDYDEKWLPDFLDELYIRKVEDAERGWYRIVQPYLRSQEALHCPSDNVSDAFRMTACKAPVLRSTSGLPAVSYGANFNLVWSWRWKEFPYATRAGMPRPAQTLLLSDCSETGAFHFCPSVTATGTRWSHIGYANGRPDDCRNTHHGGNSVADDVRHTAGSNIAFADGHVQYVPATKIDCQIEKRGKNWYQWEYPLIYPGGLVPGEEPPAP